MKTNKFNVIWWNANTNTFEPYDVISHLVSIYKENKLKLNLNNSDEVKNFILSESAYHWWSKCEYEILLQDWPCQKITKKWDVHKQVQMNIDIITEMFIEYVYVNKKPQK